MSRALATIKVDKGVRDRLAAVARARHTTIRTLVADLADRATREQRREDIDAAYARLQDDADEWASYKAELESWDAGTADTDDVAADEWPEYQQ